MTDTIVNRDEVAAFFEHYGSEVPYIIETMMTKSSFVMQDLQLIFNVDSINVRDVINDLIKLRVLKTQGGRLVKTADAIKWFKEKYFQINARHLNAR